MDSPSGGMWTIMVIVGPLLLAAALLWALLRNRKAKNSDIARSERATHDLYDREEAAHHGEDDRVP